MFSPPLNVRRHRKTAKASAFRLPYLLLKPDLEGETKTRQKIDEAVLFVVCYRIIFKYHACKTIQAAYEKRFDFSKKQESFEQMARVTFRAGNRWNVAG